MTHYESWQLLKYGNILTAPAINEDEISSDVEKHETAGNCERPSFPYDQAGKFEIENL